MEKSTTIAVLATIGLCAISVLGDYLLKKASLAEGTWVWRIWFTTGFIVYSSTAFGWVYVMRHLNFATIGVVYSVATVLLLTLVGVFFLNERLRWQEVVGIGMAIVSISLLSRFA
jgi:small multidrug resistance pump